MPDSQIPVEATITKGDAKKLYRLNDTDIRMLNFESVPHGLFHMYLYSEREVESCAWRKHGGSAGFEAYLDNLLQQCNRRHPYKPFNRPKRYGPGVIPLVQMVHYSDPYVARLLVLEQQFPAPWIWEACNKSLISTQNYPDPGSQFNALSTVFSISGEEGLGRYPQRPTSALSSSASIDALNEILGRAADISGNEEDDDNNCGLEDNSSEGETSYTWSREYRAELYDALIDIIDEHNIEGWKNVRWLVYDKFAECISGIDRLREGNDRYTWVDGANMWLWGKLTLYRHGAIYNDRVRCESGKRYNDILPAHIEGV